MQTAVYQMTKCLSSIEQMQCIKESTSTFKFSEPFALCTSTWYDNMISVSLFNTDRRSFSPPQYFIQSNQLNWANKVWWHCIWWSSYIWWSCHHVIIKITTWWSYHHINLWWSSYHRRRAHRCNYPPIEMHILSSLSWLACVASFWWEWSWWELSWWE